MRFLGSKIFSYQRNDHAADGKFRYRAEIRKLSSRWKGFQDNGA